jgi:hypothetical protein
MQVAYVKRGFVITQPEVCATAPKVGTVHWLFVLAPGVINRRGYEVCDFVFDSPIGIKRPNIDHSFLQYHH